MNRSLQVGRITGVPISVEAGLAVLAALFVVTLAVDGLPRLDADATIGVRLAVAAVTVAVFLASVLAHELGHATVARRRGVGVLGITLSLLGGFAQLDRQAPDPRSEFAIAAAGPLVNLGIGAALGLAAIGLAEIGLDHRLLIGSLLWLAAINVVLAVLNLFPASPLDGGRVLTAALWRRFGEPERARVVSGRVGVVLGLALVPVGLAQAWFVGWQGLVTAVIGLFLFNGARGEILTATIRRRLAGTATRDLMVVDPPPVQDSLTVEQLHRFAGDERAGVAFPVVRWGAEPVGYVVPADGSALGDSERSWTTVGSLMRPTPEVARAWMNESLADVLARQPVGDDLVVVIHEPAAGRVVGTLSAGQLDPVLRLPDLWGRDRPR
ncbi:MAG: site-2 protease family protein [Actinomycetota bacterium]